MAEDFGIFQNPKKIGKHIKIISIWDLKRQYVVYREGPGPLSKDGILNFLSNLLKIRSGGALGTEL